MFYDGMYALAFINSFYMETMVFYHGKFWFEHLKEDLLYLGVGHFCGGMIFLLPRGKKNSKVRFWKLYTPKNPYFIMEYIFILKNMHTHEGCKQINWNLWQALLNKIKYISNLEEIWFQGCICDQEQHQHLLFLQTHTQKKCLHKNTYPKSPTIYGWALDKVNFDFFLKKLTQCLVA